eukprot:5432415-Amphidinium_carterae.1
MKRALEVHSFMFASFSHECVDEVTTWHRYQCGVELLFHLDLPQGAFISATLFLLGAPTATHQAIPVASRLQRLYRIEGGDVVICQCCGQDERGVCVCAIYRGSAGKGYRLQTQAQFATDSIPGRRCTSFLEWCVASFCLAQGLFHAAWEQARLWCSESAALSRGQHISRVGPELIQVDGAVESVKLV